MHKFLCKMIWAPLLLGVSAAGFGQPSQNDADIFPLAAVQPGLVGYGLSVFSGFEPDRFEVEVLGVWQNIKPETSYILARLAGRGLEDSGVVAGMSGSPVYFEGRLAGAVAFAWPFSTEPLAGITPIEAMRRSLVVPEPAESEGGRLAEPVQLEELVAGRLARNRLQSQLARLQTSMSGAGGSGVLWSAVGFGEESRALLGSSLGSVAPAGRTEAAGPRELRPGDSVAGILIDGDLQLAATGTVTARVGEEILAFGHPFLGLGPMSLPMATAEVITVLPSQLSSFKITNLGHAVGAFELDRSTGVKGRLGAEAPMTPLRVSIAGERRRQFELRLAELPLLTPALIAVSVIGSLDAATQAMGSQGLDLAARFDLGEYGELALRQSFDGESAATDAALYLLAYAGYLLNNPLQRVSLSAIEVELSQHRVPRTARLVEAHASQTLVRPGDRVDLNFDLVAYRGDHFRSSMSIDIPTGLPEGRYSLMVGDGVSVDVARLEVEKTEPLTFTQALEFLRSLHSRRELVVLGLFRGAGLSVAGEVLPQLPGSVRSLWRAAPSSSATPLRLAVAQEHVIEQQVPVEGLVRIDLQVRRQGPLGAEPAAEDVEEGGDASAVGEVRPGDVTGEAADGKPKKEGS
jgi:hypothetical protein